MTGYALALARRAGFLAVAGLWIASGAHAAAASLTGRDAQIITKILGFLQPAPSGGTIAVLYAPGNAASKADAEAVAGLFGDGLPSGSFIIHAKPVALDAFGDGSGYVAIILAAGADGSSIVVKLHGKLSITGADALVKTGQCVMAVHSQPRVDITVNRGAAQAAGVGFTAAFAMLVHEE